MAHNKLAERMIGWFFTGSLIASAAIPMTYTETHSRSELVDTSRGRARVYNWDENLSRGIEVCQVNLPSTITYSDTNKDGRLDERTLIYFAPRQGVTLVTHQPITPEDQTFFDEAVSRATHISE